MADLDVIYLAATDRAMLEGFEKTCGDLSIVEIHEGSILDLEVDAVVSPANSFGYMDGGIDMIYSEHFGWHVQDRLQEKIREFHHGELLVGTAEIVPTDCDSIPWVLSAPTMRVPMILSETPNPFLAARAVFLLREHGRIREPDMVELPIAEAISSIAFPGLGTGVGAVEPEICGRQIRRAIEEFVLGEPRFPESWHEAQSSHQLLYTDTTRDLQFED